MQGRPKTAAEMARELMTLWGITITDIRKESGLSQGQTSKELSDNFPKYNISFATEDALRRIIIRKHSENLKNNPRKVWKKV